RQPALAALAAVSVLTALLLLSALAARWFKNEIPGCLASEYWHRCPTKPWVQPLDFRASHGPLKPVDLPRPDYSGFQIRKDSRRLDLSHWCEANEAEGVFEVTYLTRVMELVRIPGHGDNCTLLLEFRTEGFAVAPRCVSHPDSSSVRHVWDHEAFGRGKR